MMSPGGYPAMNATADSFHPSTARSQRSARSSRSGGWKVPPKQVKPPPVEEPLFLTFSDLTQASLGELAVAESKAEVKRLLSRFLAIDQDEGMRTEIMADMYYHLYAFCMSKGFTAEKASTLLSIAKTVLEAVVAERLPMEDAYNRYKRLLLDHCVQRPPRSVQVFTYEDARAITDYMHDTFFRHYRLYCYVYVTHCNLELLLKRDPAALPPLDQGAPLRKAQIVDPHEQPELAFLFGPSEEELAEAALRKAAAGPEDRASIVKRKVDEGIKDLMGWFENELQEQDTRFTVQLQEAGHAK